MGTSGKNHLLTQKWRAMGRGYVNRFVEGSDKNTSIFTHLSLHLGRFSVGSLHIEGGDGYGIWDDQTFREDRRLRPSIKIL